MVVVRPETIGPHPKGTAQRLTAADGFFASRCKARHARRKKAGGGCCGKTIEAEPIFGQTQSIRGREVDGADGIIWNTTGNNGISQKTTAAPCWSQSPCRSMAGFSDTDFRGDTVGL
jgi:hypothetical protein